MRKSLFDWACLLGIQKKQLLFDSLNLRGGEEQQRKQVLSSAAEDEDVWDGPSVMIAGWESGRVGELVGTGGLRAPMR